MMTDCTLINKNPKSEPIGTCRASINYSPGNRTLRRFDKKQFVSKRSISGSESLSKLISSGSVLGDRWLGGGVGPIMFMTEDTVPFLSMYQSTATNANPVTVAEVSDDGLIQGVGHYITA